MGTYEATVTGNLCGIPAGRETGISGGMRIGAAPAIFSDTVLDIPSGISEDPTGMTGTVMAMDTTDGPAGMAAPIGISARNQPMG